MYTCPVRSGIITLTTDFGLADPFVGIMKGVLLARCPRAILVDLTHGIAPGDVLGAALAVHAALPHFPPGTLHLAVVDPGVGTDRRVLCARDGDTLLLAPDNGLIPAALDPFGGGQRDRRAFFEVRTASLALPAASATFHGRDVFAPVAAALAGGEEPSALGPAVDDPAVLAFARPVSRDSAVLGEVIHVDRFGNLLTNIGGDALPASWGVVVAGRDVPSARTYGEALPGSLLALTGSLGLVEIAVRDGSAAAALGASRGTAVRLEARGNGA